MKKNKSDKAEEILLHAGTFCKTVLMAAAVGAAAGLVGSMFVVSVKFADLAFSSHSWMIFLLPAGGIMTVLLYRLGKFGEVKGSNRVIEKIRDEEKLPFRVAPIVFAGTFLTHIFGGSAGREGAAIQIGGAIGSVMGRRLFRLDEKMMPLIIMSGVSGVFSALFGTPATAAFFALEVVSVGIIHYSGLVPCLTSALVAYGVSRILGVSAGTDWDFVKIPGLDPIVLLKVAVLGVLCAVLSIIISIAFSFVKNVSDRINTSKYLKIICGAAIIIALSMIFSSGRYNGSGIIQIEEALRGEALPWDFAVKILFTAVTLGVGFKGGEIVPTFFAGATMGCMAGQLIGIDPGFSAAVCLAATFCGAVNCPVASVLLGVELFGGRGILYFAAACAISYRLSGYYSLYGSQKIIYSKIRAEYIDSKTK